MAKYAVLRCSNGSYKIEQETDDFDGAKITYRNLCNSYQKAPDVIKATATIVDDEFNVLIPYNETFKHEPQVEPEQAEEPEGE